MLTIIRVLNRQGMDQEFPVAHQDIRSSQFQLRDVIGLGPVTAKINTVPFGSSSGESFNGSSVGKRNIVLTIGLNPNWVEQSMASLRQSLYAYFMPEEKISLELFSTHLPTVGIEGYVESLEPNIFSRDPEVQVSIICPQPDFVDLDATIVSGLVDIGSPGDRTPIAYVGTRPTGFTVLVSSTIETPTYEGQFSIKNLTEFLASVSYEALVDDTHTTLFSSIQGSKFIHGLIDGESEVDNLLKTVSGETLWPRLFSGFNLFSVTGDEAGQQWSMEYFNRFGGI